MYIIMILRPTLICEISNTSGLCVRLCGTSSGVPSSIATQRCPFIQKFWTISARIDNLSLIPEKILPI